jgi:hypothetical protein
VSVSVILTILGTIFSFFTKISIQPENSLTRSDLGLSTFIISNDSLLPLSDVSYTCKVYNLIPDKLREELQTHKDEGEIGTLTSIELGPGETYLYSTLQPGDKESFNCINPAIALTNTPIQYADLDMSVSYRPLWVFWKQERKFKFKTQKPEGNNLIWIPSDKK